MRQPIAAARIGPTGRNDTHRNRKQSDEQQISQH
jgi:hypothetical protein